MKKQFVKQEKRIERSSTGISQVESLLETKVSSSQSQVASLQNQLQQLQSQTVTDAEVISALQSQLSVAQQQVSSLIAQVARLESLIWDGRISTIRNTLTGSGGTGA